MLLNSIAKTVISLILSLSIVPSLLAKTSEFPEKKIISITQIVAHPALDAVKDGIIRSLKKAGFTDENLIIYYENAQGDLAIASQIATKLLGRPNDVIVAISTPSAQTLYFNAQKGKRKIPIVFTAVTDPRAAKLYPLQGYPITGVTDEPNLDGFMEALKYLSPNIKTLGLIYNPSEANSVATLDRLKPLLLANNIKSLEATVNKIGEVPAAVRSLAGKVDILYFPQDNTVVAAIESLVNVAHQASLPIILPIYTTDKSLFSRGVLAAVGYNYEEIGTETGDIIVQILKGKPASSIPIRKPKNLITIINKKMAEELNLKLHNSKFKYSRLVFE